MSVCNPLHSLQSFSSLDELWIGTSIELLWHVFVGKGFLARRPSTYVLFSYFIFWTAKQEGHHILDKIFHYMEHCNRYGIFNCFMFLPLRRIKQLSVIKTTLIQHWKCFQIQFWNHNDVYILEVTKNNWIYKNCWWISI